MLLMLKVATFNKYLPVPVERARKISPSPLEPMLSAAPYPPLRKTQGRGNPHYVGDVGAIKSPGRPP